MEISNILLATDFSTGSRQAAPYAADLANRYGATLYVVHVIQNNENNTDFYAPKVNLKELHGTVEGKFMKDLQSFCDQELAGYPKIERRLLRGTPAEEIIRFQQANQIGMIVIGTRERKTDAREETIGLTADDVIKNAGCPVLTVIPSAERTKESTDPRLCSDGEIRL
jgi:nucleotide-binding universal stress UspA family protein